MLAHGLFWARLAQDGLLFKMSKSDTPEVTVRAYRSLWSEPVPGVIAEIREDYQMGALLLMASLERGVSLDDKSSTIKASSRSKLVIAEVRRRLMQWTDSRVEIASVLLFAAATNPHHPFWHLGFRSKAHKRDRSLPMR